MTSRIQKHGWLAGHHDYLDRADEVAIGAAEESWAWPLTSADEAYINAVGTSGICRAIGVPEAAWDEISDEWCDAFRRGYIEAREHVS